MGTSKSSVYNGIFKIICSFSIESKVWIIAAHIPGAENVTAGYESRKGYKDAE